MIAGQILAAQADYVSRLIKTATSDEEVYDSVDADGRPVTVRQPIYTRDRVLVVQELEKILAGVLADAPAGEGEAARCLASRPQWLSGPTTMTVRMVAGTGVNIAGGERPVMEAEARVVDSTPADAEAD